MSPDVKAATDEEVVLAKHWAEVMHEEYGKKSELRPYGPWWIHHGGDLAWACLGLIARIEADAEVVKAARETADSDCVGCESGPFPDCKYNPAVDDEDYRCSWWPFLAALAARDAKGEQ